MRPLFIAAATLLAACSAPTEAQTPPAPANPATAETNKSMPQTSLYDIALTDIDGQTMTLAQYQGRPILVVNTASKCGYTGQYEGLQALWTTFKNEGLVVIGVPSNNFGGQEPGSEEQVKSFCQINYGVDFPLTAKADVVGAARHPLYAAFEAELGDTAVPKWNFHKVLIGADGHAVKAYPSAVKPADAELVADIEAELKG